MSLLLALLQWVWPNPFSFSRNPVYNGPMALPNKECPKCLAESRLDAQVCQRCGHKFRTQFVHGAALPAEPNNSPRRWNWIPIVALCLAIPPALIVLSLLFIGRTAEHNAPAPLPPTHEVNAARSNWDTPQRVELHDTPSMVMGVLGEPNESQGDSRGNERADWHYNYTGGGRLDVTFIGGHVVSIHEQDGGGFPLRNVADPAYYQ